MEEKVPIWEKPYLTLEEATAFYNIGIHKLRAILDQPECEMYILWVGNKRLIKKDLLTKHLQTEFSI